MSTGFSLDGNVTLAVGNPGAVPSQRISRPFTASATPEVPTCALGLLSFVPYGIARLRMRKR